MKGLSVCLCNDGLCGECNATIARISELEALLREGRRFVRINTSVGGQADLAARIDAALEASG